MSIITQRSGGLRVAAALALALSAGACATTGAPGPTAAAPPAALKLWSGFPDHPGGYSDKTTVVNAAGYIGPPPAADSAQQKDDEQAFRASRALKDTPRWLQAGADNEIETPRAPFKAFACALGGEVKPEEAPTLTLLLGKVLGEVQLAQHDLKTTTFRTRPFVGTDLPTCIAPEVWLAKSSSYPSGHAATGFAWGLILASLAPDHRAEILNRGIAYGESRLVCGVHFRSDVEAGRVMGAGIVATLEAKPEFRADADVARAELARALAGKTAPADCGQTRF